MAVEIVAGVGNVAANSFVTAEEMTAYCEGRLNASAWSEDDENNLAALVEATRDLNVLPWKGARSTSTQALAWPRVDVENPDLRAVNDGLFLDPLSRRLLVTYDGQVIPDRVKRATCELALQYLKAGTTDLAVADPTAGVIRKKVGPLETEWANAGAGAKVNGVSRFFRVWNELRPLLTSGGSGSLTLERL